MSKRLYFTCPIKAAYMAQQFGVKFEQWLYPFVESTERELMLQSFKQICEEIQYHFNRDRKFDYDNRYIVAKESESIFEPKEGDKDNAGNVWCDFYKNGKITLMQLNGMYSQRIEDKKQIFVRDNKHFFAAEVEND